MKRIRYSLFATILLGLALISGSGCVTTGAEHIGQSRSMDSPREIDNPMSLRDFLVKAGVTIDYQSGVPLIKGGQPLYVVDGVRMGHDYYQVARTVNVNDIGSVEVIKSTAQALMYGRDAGNGVILIKTKVGV
jgi:hypothetical protein